MSQRLHPADIEAIAARVADLLRGEPQVGTLLTAAEVARRFGVAAEWVRQHADDLDVVRLGDGPRPRLRFDPAKVADRLVARSPSKGSGIPDRPRRRATSLRSRPVTGGGRPLLPIEGQE